MDHDRLEVQLKEAAVLGRPITKGVYRQLPRYQGVWFAGIDDTISLVPTLYGKVNWCPPDCDAETSCACVGVCSRRPPCRQKRAHQHLLIGAQGAPHQGFLYLYAHPDDEDWIIPPTLWTQYEPLAEEREVQQCTLRTLRGAEMKSGNIWMLPAEHREEARTRHAALAMQRKDRETRVATLDRTLDHLERQSTVMVAQFKEHTLAALPIILLR